MKNTLTLFICLLLLASCQKSKESTSEKPSTIQKVLSKLSLQRKLPDIDYPKALEELETKRSNFKKTYTKAAPTEKKAILKKAKMALYNSLVEEVFPAWYGTHWDFNGTTQTPREGKIACGYFITHTLKDTGFKIPRIKWAQAASETMIKQLMPKEIKRFSGKSIDDIATYLKSQGDAIYVVGLDSHVGFIVVQGEEMSFVHASYYDPKIGVLSESIFTQNPLSDSNYRILGKMLSDEMLIKWIHQTPFP